MITVTKDDNPEFDAHAANYRSLHMQNIRMSGENPDFFAEYKVKECLKFTKERKIEIQRILDFGSGIGNSIPYFSTYFPESELECCDVSQESISLAQEKYPYAKYHRIDGNFIPLTDGSVNFSFAACVFHHIPESQHVQWLSELRRVTCSGGILAIFEHNPLNPLTRYAVNTCPLDKNAILINASLLAKRIEKAGWIECKISYKLFFPRFLHKARWLEHYLECCPLGAQYLIYAVRT